MRAGMQVAGSAIERVFHPPHAPARRFGGIIDAGLTVAMGSVCAFALTLGPAPLNTVAVSSAAAAAFSDQLGPAPHGIAVLPVDDNTSDTRAAEAPPATSPGHSAGSAADSGASAKFPVGATPSAPPATALKAPTPLETEAPSMVPPIASLTPAQAVSAVEAYRVAAGLGAFVPADACPESILHTTVLVSPSGVLPLGLAKDSLAPDPAYASVTRAVGTISVTIHTCQ